MRYWAVVISLIMSSPTWAGPSEDFKAANELYKEAYYDSAAQVYQKLVDDGYESKELYFNLGNAYYRSGDIAHCMLYLEKARKLDPSDDDVLYNIEEIAVPAVGNSFTPEGSSGIGAALNKVISSREKNFWSWSTLVLIGSGFLLLILYLYAGTTLLKRATFYTGITVICLGLVTLSFALAHKSYMLSEDEGVIMAFVTVRSEPSDNAQTTFDLRPGTKVEILDENELWYRIEVDEKQGWILREALEII